MKIISIEKKYFLFWGLCFLTYDLAYPQFTFLVPEHAEAISEMTDQQRVVDSLVEWSYDLGYQQAARSQSYAKKAFEMADDIGYHKGRGDSRVRIGLLHMNAGEYAAARKCFSEAANIRKTLGDYRGVASCFNNMGTAFKHESKYDSADYSFLQGLEAIGPLHQDKVTVALHNNRAANLRYMGLPDQALDHLKQSLTLCESMAYRKGEASANLNLGNLLQASLDQKEQAYHHLQRSHQLYKDIGDDRGLAKCHVQIGNNFFYREHYDSAQINYVEALKYQAILSHHDQAIIHKNMGSILTRSAKTIEAGIAAFRKSLQNFEELGNRREIASIYFEIGNAFLSKKQPNEAMAQYQKALQQFQRFDDPVLRSLILFATARTLDQLNQIQEASAVKDEYIYLQDSLYQAYRATDKSLNEMRMENSELKLSIAQQKTASALKANQVQRTYGLIGFGVTWLLLGLTAMGFFINRQKRNIAEKNQQLMRQETAELVREKELEAAYAWLEGEEKARQSIGKELHDGIGNVLSMVKLHFSSIDMKIRDHHTDNLEKYRTAETLLEKACEDVRKLSHEMTSAMLINFGLKSQLEALAETIESSGQLKVELNTHGLSNRLGNKMEINIYRMIQELVNNVIKHAYASKISIQANYFKNLINIMVEDNGLGFDKEKIRPKGGLGMRNLYSRVNDLNGKLNIDTHPGQGTIVNIDIPI